MAQQGASVTVYQGTQPTVIRTVQPTVVPVPIRRPTLPHRESHKRLGIIQMCVGSLCFALSILGFIVGATSYYQYFGSGIYSGIFFIIPGILGFFAFRQNSKCLVVACMVMCIIAACVAVIGLSFASIELAVNYNSSGFQQIKCGIMIFCCVFELVTAIVHAGFTCASCCDCCLPREAVCVPGNVTGPVVVQSLPQTNIPGQTYQFYGQLPQQQTVVVQQQPSQSYPQQQYVQNYPQQQFIQIPQQNLMSSSDTQPDANPPPYNPNMAYGESMNNPPPYAEMVPSGK